MMPRTFAVILTVKVEDHGVYTMDPSSRWEYCDVKLCTKASGNTCNTDNGNVRVSKT